MTKDQRHIVLILLFALAIIPLAVIEKSAAALSNTQKELSFNPPEGYYARDIQLKIEYPDPNVEILFTMDGSEPTPANGEFYSHSILIGAGQQPATVVRARVRFPDGSLGPTTSATYLGAGIALPALSIVAELDDLWGEETGLYSHPYGRGIGWEKAAEVTFLDRDQQLAFHVPAGLRIHGNSTRGIEKKSLRLYFRREYGLNRLDYPIFAGSELPDLVDIDSLPKSFKRLVVHDGGQDFAYPGYGANWTLIRTQLMDALANQVDFPTTQSRPVLLFLNGEPQGVFLIRNYADRWYLADEFGVQETPLDESKIHWDHLLEFIETHDLKDAANFAYVQSQVDLANLIDYFVLQMYATDTDWLYTNVRRFLPDSQGGRWNYLFWDVDYSFGLAPWTDYDYDMVDYVFNATRPGMEKEAAPFRRLMENPDFKAAFLARTADLLNTVLAPERVEKLVDALAAELQPGVQLESALWSSPGDWENSIQYLKEFAGKRPDLFRQHLAEHLDLSSYRIRFDPPKVGGQLAVDGVLLGGRSWDGQYFQETRVLVTAVPEPGFQFAGWLGEAETGEGGIDLPGTPQLSLSVDRPLALTASFEPAPKEAVRPGDVIISQVRLNADRAGSDLIELQVVRPGGVDLRGWRLTDNDTKLATDEGSLVFSRNAALAHIPDGTLILILVPSDGRTPTGEDDLSVWDGQMVLNAGGAQVDTRADPWFDLVQGDDLVLLSPGPGPDPDDDRGVAFLHIGDYNQMIVTPETFGVLADGVTTGMKMIDP